MNLELLKTKAQDISDRSKLFKTLSSCRKENAMEHSHFKLFWNRNECTAKRKCNGCGKLQVMCKLHPCDKKLPRVTINSMDAFQSYTYGSGQILNSCYIDTFLEAILDPMPTYLILQLLDVLLPVITTMINLLFNTGYFAHAWKEALVLPSLKKPGLDVAFKNFRPVSNLPYISKLSERAAACQLTQYMTDNDLHSVFQSAYKPNHSTETALLKVKNDILMNMNDQHVTLLVLLDLSAAFDTVHRDILIARLKNDLGIEGDALS